MKEGLTACAQFRGGVCRQPEADQLPDSKVLKRTSFDAHRGELERGAKADLAQRMLHAYAGLRSVTAPVAPFACEAAQDGIGDDRWKGQVEQARGMRHSYLKTET